MDSSQKKLCNRSRKKLKDRHRTIGIMEKRLSQLEQRDQRSSLNNQEQNYGNTCHTNNGCSSNNNSCQIQQIRTITDYTNGNATAAKYTPKTGNMQCHPQYQQYNHGMYTVNPSTGTYIPPSFHIPPPLPTFRPHQFMNHQTGQPTPTMLQQPPLFHHQIHVPSFIQPPNQRPQYQNINHPIGPGIPPPTYLQSGFNINPPIDNQTKLRTKNHLYFTNILWTRPRQKRITMKISQS
ncbi:unnamed protein product [Mytilus edulis]|uniref:Uncharacterized protein n=1 Tax=Mytilus edulis TaxID=6550 RepID=A0A8S3SLA3_MYTED|nr:unnamed protein product [Mytilus edulis]